MIHDEIVRVTIFDIFIVDDFIVDLCFIDSEKQINFKKSHSKS